MKTKYEQYMDRQSVSEDLHARLLALEKQQPKVKPIRWQRWAALAASLALVLGLGLYASNHLLTGGASVAEQTAAVTEETALEEASEPDLALAEEAPAEAVAEGAAPSEAADADLQDREEAAEEEAADAALTENAVEGNTPSAEEALALLNSFKSYTRLEVWTTGQTAVKEGQMDLEAFLDSQSWTVQAAADSAANDPEETIILTNEDGIELWLQSDLDYAEIVDPYGTGMNLYFYSGEADGTLLAELMPWALAQEGQSGVSIHRQ